MLFIEHLRNLSRVLHCDKTRPTFENTREMLKHELHEPQVSVFYISRVSQMSGLFYYSVMHGLRFFIFFKI